MMTNANSKQGLGIMHYFNNQFLKKYVWGVLFFVGFQSNLVAQDTKFTRSAWWFGAATGANYNLFHGSSIQNLNSTLIAPSAFIDGNGLGIYAAPLIEYHPSDSKVGFMLQAGYDSKKGSFNQVISTDIFTEDLSTHLTYFTIEPSIRLNLFRSNFYLFSGPRLSININNNFQYDLRISPDHPEQGSSSYSAGQFSDINKTVISMQIGGGYDLFLTAKNKRSQVILSPFFALQPYFGQKILSSESWNISTLRAGIALKFGHGIKTALPEKIFLPVVISTEPKASYLITEPKEDTAGKNVSELLSERNNVYFNLRSSEIKDPFSTSGKNQLKNFKNNLNEIRIPENLENPSFRKAIQEDNFLSILGDNMTKDLSTQITLVGSSKDVLAGIQMAKSVKMFLVRVYGISASKIAIKSQKKLKIHKTQSANKFELAVIRQVDRQVLVQTTSKALALKFQVGQNNTRLSPLKIYDVPEINKEGVVSFTTKGSDQLFSSWSLKIAEDKTKVRSFGPFTNDSVSIPKNYLLGGKPAGKFDISMIGQLKSGQIMRKDTTAYLTAWPVFITDKIKRFSVLYELNNSESVKTLSQYLRTVVTPEIPSGAMVVIHGHSESANLGNNQLKSFLARENNIQELIEHELLLANRRDVEFQVFDFGLDQTIAPFEKKTQKIDFLNRTIIIDILKP